MLTGLEGNGKVMCAPPYQHHGNPGYWSESRQAGAIRHDAAVSISYDTYVVL